MATSIPSQSRSVLSLDYAPPEAVERENAAARIIQKCWRHSRAGIDHLAKDLQALTVMPHGNYKRHCFRSIRPLLMRGISNPIRRCSVAKAVKNFESSRELWQTQRFIPYCSQQWKEGEIPRCEMITEDQVHSSDRRFGHIYLSADARKALFTIKKSPPKNKQELDALVRQIAALTNVIPWEYLKRGCELRAPFVIDLLVLSGIPIEKIGRQFSILPDRFNGYNWNYHVAARVTLADGSSWIVDPSFASTKALDVLTWNSRQRRNLLPNEFMLLLNKGSISLPSNKRPRYIEYNRDTAVTFSTPANCVLQEIFEDTGMLKIAASEANYEDDMRDLAIDRNNLEKSWLHFRA